MNAGVMTCAIALLMLSDFETLIEANMMTYILKLLLECEQSRAEQSSRDSISSRCKTIATHFGTHVLLYFCAAAGKSSPASVCAVRLPCVTARLHPHMCLPALFPSRALGFRV